MPRIIPQEDSYISVTLILKSLSCGQEDVAFMPGELLDLLLLMHMMEVLRSVNPSLYLNQLMTLPCCMSLSTTVALRRAFWANSCGKLAHDHTPQCRHQIFSLPFHQD